MTTSTTMMTGGTFRSNPRTAIVEPTTPTRSADTRPMTTSATWPQTGTASMNARDDKATVNPISAGVNPRSARIADRNGKHAQDRPGEQEEGADRDPLPMVAGPRQPVVIGP